MIDKNKNENTPQLNKKKVKMHQSLAKPEVSDFIGERLRTFYDDVAKQPVPDRFLDLLSKLQTARPPEKKN